MKKKRNCPILFSDFLKDVNILCPDSAHVRAAEAYFRFCPEELKPKLARAILHWAAETGVDVKSPVVLEYAGVN